MASDSTDRAQSSLADKVIRNGSEFLHAAAYTDIQTPVTAIAQIVDAGCHTDLLPQVQFIAAPQKLQSGDDGYWAQTLGSAAGSLLPFVLTGAAVKSMSGLALADSVASREALIGLSSREAFLTGALHDSILRPSDPNDGKPFLLSRALNGLAGGTSMLAMVKLGGLANEEAAKFLSPEVYKYAQIPVVMASAMPAGALGAQLNSLASDGRLATREEMTQAAVSNALVAGFFAGAQGYSSTKADMSLKSFRVDGGADSVKQGMGRFNAAGEATFAAREDLGRHGLLGLFGVHNYGESRSLTVRDAFAAPPLSVQRAGSLDLLATCYPDAKLSEHGIFSGAQENRPLWMRPTGGRLQFSLKDGLSPEWQHLGVVRPEALLDGVRSGNLDAVRQSIDLLERVKYRQPLSTKDVAGAESLLRVNSKTFQSGISPDGEQILSKLSNTEQALAKKTLDAVIASRNGATAEAGSETVTPTELKQWQTLNGAVDFRVSVLGERRALTSSELDLVNSINKQARERIYQLEEQKASGKPLTTEQQQLLSELNDGQDMVFDSAANRQLLDLSEIEDAGEPLSFDQSVRRRIANRLVDEGISHYNKLAQIRGQSGLTELEAKSLSELQEAHDSARNREQNAVNSIRANNGNRAGEILGARQRLLAFQQDAWQRQDPNAFEQGLAALKGKQYQLKETTRRASSHDQLNEATQQVQKAQQALADQQLSQNGVNRVTQDMSVIQSRVNRLARVADPTDSQATELADLRALSGQTVEGIFRDYVPWAPEALDKNQSLLAPFALRTIGLKDGNNDEQALAVALGNVLEGGNLHLKGTQPYQTADYLNPKNWSGIHVPDGAAADHAKADYILFNRKTGHYFIFDITSSVENGASQLLAHDMVARGNEVLLANRKAMVAPEREPFILATSPDADWSSPKSNEIGMARLSNIISNVISRDQPFNIAETYLPSTNPELPSSVKAQQLQNFQRSLQKINHSDWAREVGSAIGYVRAH